jgi:predicted phosphate transport protein (TIGR00153 family)
MKIRGGREREAVSILKEACSKLSEMGARCEEFFGLVFEEGDLRRAEALGKKIAELESQADEARRKFIQKLYDGAFLPAMRGDLVELAERMDKVADAIEETSKCMLLREGLLQKLGKRTKEVGEGLRKVAGKSREVVDSLMEAVNLLFVDINQVIPKVDEIQKLEHESDLLETEFTASLAELEKGLDALSVVQLEGLVRRLGSISDAAEDTGDVLLRLVSGLKG